MRAWRDGCQLRRAIAAPPCERGTCSRTSCRASAATASSRRARRASNRFTRPTRSAPPCGPPSPYASLFGPPPCAGCNECTSAQPANAPPESPGDQPCIDRRAQLSPYSTDDFSPDPLYDQPYDACAELGVYGDKYLNPTQRPLIEWGFPLYDTGPVPPPSLDCGPTNPSLPRFYLYGDYRAAAAYNDQNGNAKGVIANRLNLEWDLWLTSTERFHMFTGPFQRGNNFQRVEFDNGDSEFFNELDFFDADTDTAFFEGDLGYMLGGWTGKYAQFDMPVTVGLIPLAVPERRVDGGRDRRRRDHDPGPQ